MPTHCTITCFGFRTRRIDGIECGLFSIHAPLGQRRVSVYSTGESWEGDCMCNCFCGVIVLWSVRWWWKEGRRWNPVLAHSLLFSKSTKGAARLNVPIRWTNRYQQYYMPCQHTYWRRVWNLIQTCDVQSSDYKVYISTPPSSEVENFQLKIYYPGGDRTPDLLNQRQTCYHLSKPNSMTLSTFPGKIPEPLNLILFFVWQSPKVAPKPPDRSHSNSISSFLLQISWAGFFSYLIYP